MDCASDNPHRPPMTKQIARPTPQYAAVAANDAQKNRHGQGDEQGDRREPHQPDHSAVGLGALETCSSSVAACAALRRRTPPQSVREGV